MWPFNFRYPHTEYHPRIENSQYPYTDYHIIDLDFIVQQLKDLWEAIHNAPFFEIPLPIYKGGTHATSSAQARTNLGLGDVATDNVVPVTKGGTGGTNAAQARTNLGLGSVATESTLPISKGGTGATTAATAYNSLAVAGLGTKAPITSASLDNYKTAGCYWFYASATETPIAGFHGSLFVLNSPATSSHETLQIAICNDNLYIRAYTDVTGVWANWEELCISNASYISSLINKRVTEIPRNTDLNNYTTPGSYYCNSANDAAEISHSPISGNYRLEVVSGGSEEYSTSIMQFAWGTGNDNIYYRRKSTTWTPWAHLISENDYGSYTVTNGEIASSGLSVTKLYKMVVIEGNVRVNAQAYTSQGTVLFTIPAAIRPSSDRVALLHADTHTYPIRIKPNGDVVFNTAYTFSAMSYLFGDIIYCI